MMRVLYWILFWIHFPILLSWALAGSVLTLIGELFNFFELKVYGIRLMIAADQMGNGFAAGFPDETISSRVGRAIHTGKPKMIARFLAVVVNAIFFWQKNHVLESIEYDEFFDDKYEPWPWSVWTKEELEAKKKRGR